MCQSLRATTQAQGYILALMYWRLVKNLSIETHYMAPTCYMATLSHYAAAAYHVRQKKTNHKNKTFNKTCKKNFGGFGPCLSCARRCSTRCFLPQLWQIFHINEVLALCEVFFFVCSSSIWPDCSKNLFLLEWHKFDVLMKCFFFFLNHNLVS